MLAGITALLVGVIAVFNDVNIQIRMREMKFFLHESNRTDNSIDHIGLVMKYRLHRDIYENRITTEEMNLIEVRVNAILSGMELEKKTLDGRYRYASVPVIHVINFIRYLIGMPRLRRGRISDESGDIDIAYYYERNKLYHRAIEEYNRILEGGVEDRTLKAGILLHLGYCYSILGDFADAKKFYMSVIKDYGDINVAVTAALLLRYIEGFRSEIEKVVKYRDSVEKGEKLYKLIAYRESLEVLNRVERSVSAGEKSKIKYFKGRTLEELGDADKAVDIYQEIVMDDTKSPYARDANRRIFIMGGLAAGGEKIRNLARKNNRLLDDSLFEKLVDENIKFSSWNRDETENRLKEILPDEQGEQKAAGTVREKKVEMMIRKVEERISGKVQTREVRKVVPEKRMVRIYTTDGNIFTGILISDRGGAVVVRTSLGDIRIEKSRISRRIDL
ncbi:MAG TPA: tetratricopeptide repeat protein [Spirochaetota bacterium]|nr:tetratricopeptide repeat protein [Spirochaetota bacterium]